MARIGDFAFGLILMIAQSALFGMLALWFASRASRIARVLGALVVLALVWLSAVAVINRVTGYLTGSDIETNVLIIGALVLGWAGGRNRRILESPADEKKSSPWVPRQLQSVGGGVQVLSFFFGGGWGCLPF